MIDRKLWHEHLAQADRHVAEGKQQVARQREIVAKLERDGHNAAAPRDLLRLFEEMQAMYIADRDRILKDLGGG
jgi:hypothetical protein